MVGIFNQGDIIEVDFNPTRGHEPANTRPALVVSSFDFNMSTSMTLVCPITNRIKPFPLHEELPADAPVTGSVVIEQVRALDLSARGATLIGTLDRETLHRILVCLRSFFEMDEDKLM